MTYKTLMHQLFEKVDPDTQFKEGWEKVLDAKIDRELTAQEFGVLIRYFGLRNEKEHFLSEIAGISQLFFRLKGVSVERVRQIKAKALSKLRKAILADSASFFKS